MNRYRRILLTIVMSVFMMSGCGDNPSEEGLVLLQEANYEEAIVKFQEAIEDEKNVDDAYRGIGIAKWELEDYEGAGIAFREALDNGAEETATLYNFLGTCEMKMGNYKRALNYYRLGMELEGCTGEMLQEMRFNEIAALEKIGDWDNARFKLEEYVADYPDDVQAAKEAEFFETR